MHQSARRARRPPPPALSYNPRLVLRLQPLFLPVDRHLQRARPRAKSRTRRFLPPMRDVREIPPCAVPALGVTFVNFRDCRAVTAATRPWCDFRVTFASPAASTKAVRNRLIGHARSRRAPRRGRCPSGKRRPWCYLRYFDPRPVSATAPPPSVLLCLSLAARLSRLPHALLRSAPRPRRGARRARL